jgi:hypothetical protein
MGFQSERLRASGVPPDLFHFHRVIESAAYLACSRGKIITEGRCGCLQAVGLVWLGLALPFSSPRQRRERRAAGGGRRVGPRRLTTAGNKKFKGVDELTESKQQT